MARKPIQNLPAAAPEVVDYTQEAICEAHLPRDESAITCFSAIRASMGADAYKYYLVGEIQRRAWALPHVFMSEPEGALDALERLEFFVAALRKEAGKEA